MKYDWTPERIETLKRLWAEGWSCSQIAASMGTTSRNAVIGKVHRLKLAARDFKVSRLKKSKPAPVKKSAPVKKPDPPPQPLIPSERTPDRELVPLLELTANQCRYPFGEPGKLGFGFCGDAKVPGTSYCDEHLKTCCQPFVPRQRQPQKELTT